MAPDSGAEIEPEGGGQTVAALHLEHAEDAIPGEAVRGFDERSAVEDAAAGAEDAHERADRGSGDQLRLELAAVEERPCPGVGVACAAAAAEDDAELPVADLGFETLAVERQLLQHAAAALAGQRDQLRQDAHRGPEGTLLQQPAQPLAHLPCMG